MRTNRKRVPVAFLFRASDGLGANGKVIARSYGNVIEGVFTRASKATAGGTALQYDAFATFAHSQPRFALAGPSALPSILLEGAATNYILQSQTFDNASWVKTNVTVTANSVTAPDGTLTADTVAATASLATTLSQTEATIASTAVNYSIYGKLGSGAADCNKFVVRNATTATDLLSVAIDWSSGVVTLVAGAGTYRSVELLDGWWRIELGVTTGITSGNDIAVYPGFIGTAETAGEYAYFWGAQLEATAFATSYIATTTVAVARAADSLYFPWSLAPNPGLTSGVTHTIYVRFVERGSASSGGSQGVLSLGAGGNPSVLLLTGGAGSYYAIYRTGTDATSGSPSGVAAIDDTVELLLTLTLAGVLTVSQSINGGTTTVGAASAAKALPTAWDSPRLYLGSRGAGTEGHFAFTHAALNLGSKTMTEMRDLAEVV